MPGRVGIQVEAQKKSMEGRLSTDPHRSPRIWKEELRGLAADRCMLFAFGMGGGTAVLSAKASVKAEATPVAEGYAVDPDRALGTGQASDSASLTTDY